MNTPNDAVIEYWLDSGANIHSRYTGEVSLEELGLTGEEWDDMRNEYKDGLMRELAFEKSEWNYRVK